MIVSHEHRYVFIEIPHTGTSSIRRELCEVYGGDALPIRRHANYHEFKKISGADELNYFVFACLRNPMDVVVTRYFKERTDHEGRFSGTAQGSVPPELRVRRDSLRRFRYLQRTNADFGTYFMKFYRWPYGNAIQDSRPYCDFIIRYENLAEDFSKALSRVGLELIRPLPQANRTGQKRANYLDYYPPHTISRQKWVFGRFLQDMELEVPSEWGRYRPSLANRLTYSSLNSLRHLAWKYWRPAPLRSKRAEETVRELPSP